MRIGKVLCRNLQAVEVFYRIGFSGFQNFPVFPIRDASNLPDPLILLLFKMPDKVQKGPFPFTKDHIIHFREVPEQVFPKKSRSNPAEDNLRLQVELFRRASYVYGAPAVSMKDGKPIPLSWMRGPFLPCRGSRPAFPLTVGRTRSYTGFLWKLGELSLSPFPRRA